MTGGAEQIVAAIGGWLTGSSGAQRGSRRSLVVAIDGHGASGKTTIAGEVAEELGALTIHTDDYFKEPPRRRSTAATISSAAGGGRAEAETETGAESMSRYYDWHALRTRALEPALRSAHELILLEGVSSASMAAADLVGRAVLVFTPEAVRLERLHARISDEEWDEEWLAAERRYFAARPRHSFDLVVAGFDDWPRTPTIAGR